MRLDKLPYDGETQPCASAGARARLVDAVEAIEEVSPILDGEARSSVSCGEGQPAPWTQGQQGSWCGGRRAFGTLIHVKGPAGDSHPATWRGMTDRIAQ